MKRAIFNVGFTSGYSQIIEYLEGKGGKIKIVKASCDCYHGSNIRIKDPKCWHMKSAKNLLLKRLKKCYV